MDSQESKDELTMFIAYGFEKLQRFRAATFFHIYIIQCIIALTCIKYVRNLTSKERTNGYTRSNLNCERYIPLPNTSELDY